MKRHYKILAAVIVGAIAAAGILVLAHVGDSGKKMVEQTRRQLREQGFKADLNDFNLFAMSCFTIAIVKPNFDGPSEPAHGRKCAPFPA